jgi:hypothetical protein
LEAAALPALEVDDLAMQQAPILRNSETDKQCDIAYFKQVLWHDVFTHGAPQWLRSKETNNSACHSKAGAPEPSLKSG